MANYMSINSFFGASNTNSTNWMSGMSSLYSDYNSIRSGSYYKLLKAYYSEDTYTKKPVEEDAVSKKNNTEKIELTEAKADATELKDAATALTARGTKSLFEKKEMKTKDEDGKETTTVDYDRKAIEKAVTAFVENYNDAIKSGSDVNSTNVLRKTLQLTQNTAANKNLLAKVGVEIGEDNKLSVNKDTLQNARITDLKSLFEGRDSYAGRTADKASQIAAAAVKEAAKTNSLYTSSATYYNKQNYNSVFDSLY